MTATAELALGRILRIASRPSEPGDVEEYERCRLMILAELGGHDQSPHWTPCFARDRLCGAAGDMR